MTDIKRKETIKRLGNLVNNVIYYNEKLQLYYRFFDNFDHYTEAINSFDDLYTTKHFLIGNYEMIVSLDDFRYEWDSFRDELFNPIIKKKKIMEFRPYNVLTVFFKKFHEALEFKTRLIMEKGINYKEDELILNYNNKIQGNIYKNLFENEFSYNQIKKKFDDAKFFKNKKSRYYARILKSNTSYQSIRIKRIEKRHKTEKLIYKNINYLKLIK